MHYDGDTNFHMRVGPSRAKREGPVSGCGWQPPSVRSGRRTRRASWSLVERVVRTALGLDVRAATAFVVVAATAFVAAVVPTACESRWDWVQKSLCERGGCGGAGPYGPVVR